MSATDLDRARIEEELLAAGSEIGKPLTILGTTASTNDDAKAAAAAGAPHGATFIADAQTAGRGRGGHKWFSPPGQNLYLSTLLRPNVAPVDIAPITLAVGLAVARVVLRCGALEGRVSLKWPNDVYVDARKIAGVLVEGQLRGDRLTSLVVGVGLNVGSHSFPPELSGRATSLALAGATDLDRTRLAAMLIAEIGCVAAAFEAAHLAPLLAEIRALDFLKGRAVEVGATAAGAADSAKAGALRGVACGIDDAGALLINDATGAMHTVRSGEVLPFVA